MAAPALAVVGRGEQLVDQPREGVGPVVGRRTPRPARARAAGRSGRSGPADQRPAVGPGDGVQPLGPVPGGDEPVDRLRGPAGRVVGRRDGPERLERPVRLALRSAWPRRTSARARRRRSRRPGRPGRREAAACSGGILSVVVGVADRPDQQAALRVARDDGRAALAARRASPRASRAAGRRWSSSRRGTSGTVPASTGRTFSSKKLSESAFGGNRTGCGRGREKQGRERKCTCHPGHARVSSTVPGSGSIVQPLSNYLTKGQYCGRAPFFRPSETERRTAWFVEGGRRPLYGSAGRRPILDGDLAANGRIDNDPEVALTNLVRGASSTAYSFVISVRPRRARPSPSLFRSTQERRKRHCRNPHLDATESGGRMNTTRKSAVFRRRSSRASHRDCQSPGLRADQWTC